MESEPLCPPLPPQPPSLWRDAVEELRGQCLLCPAVEQLLADGINLREQIEAVCLAPEGPVKGEAGR